MYSVHAGVDGGAFRAEEKNGLLMEQCETIHEVKKEDRKILPSNNSRTPDHPVNLKDKC